MGDDNVQLVEKMIENTIDDVKELKTDYKDLKREVADIHRKQGITDNSVNQFHGMFSNLESQFKALRDEWKEDKKEDQKRHEKEREEEIKRYEQRERDQRNRWWGFAITIITTIILIQLGLK